MGGGVAQRKEIVFKYIIPAAVLAPPVVVALYVRQDRPSKGEFQSQNIFYVVLRIMLHAALNPVDKEGARVILTVPPALGQPVKS